MKKILIITPFNDLRGGVEVVTEILVQGLRERNFECEYLCIEDEVSYPSWLRICSIFLGKSVFTTWKYRTKKIKDYDYVICNGEYAWLVNHPRAIAYFHGSYKGYMESKKNELKIKNKISLTVRSWQQYMGAKNKKVVAVSESLKKILESQGIAVDAVISNPVDTIRFAPKASKREGCLYVGRNDGYAKGFDVLLKLAEMGLQVTCLTDKIPDKKIKYIPFMDNKLLPDIYNKYCIFLFLSRFEAFGLSAAEALSCGLPMIMGDVGFAEILKKEIPEYVVSSYEPKEIMDKINIINNSYEEFSRRSREFALKNFSLELYFNNWMNLLKD